MIEWVRREPGRSVAWVVAIMLWCALLGVLAGRIWMAVWEPPMGQAYQHEWYPVPWDAGSKDAFAATGSFVLIALSAGLITGVVALLVSRAGDLVTLGAVVVGTCLASALMLHHGIAASPPDPASAAKKAADGTAILGTLAVPGWSARACLPLGAVVVFAVWFLIFTRPSTGEPELIGAEQEQV